MTELLVPELSTLHEKKRQQIIKNKTKEGNETQNSKFPILKKFKLSLIKESMQSLVTSKQMYCSKNSFMDDLAKKAAYKGNGISYALILL